MNKKIIIFIISRLLMLEGFLISLSSLISFFYNENDYKYILFSGLITISVGFITLLFVRKAKKDIKKREAYIIVTLVWVVFSAFGALPFYLSGSIPSYTDAYFETISGFTTTGASILNDIESLSHGLLFWRSLTQWLGGMGIIVLSLAILPLLGIGGMQLFAAESPGPTVDKIHPKISETAKRLWIIYVIFTLTETLLLWLGKMNFFDAICHSFTTLATGGYSTKQASIGYWTSPYIHYVITFFMFLAGVNFTVSYFAFKFDFKKVFKNQEFLFYLKLTLIAIIGFTAILVYNGGLLEKSFRDSAFQIVSIITTTGFATADYMKWPQILIMLLFVFMFIGGSAGSTGGGIKVIRIQILLKNTLLEFKKLLHPQAIINVKQNNKTVSQQIVFNILAFVGLYIIIFVIGVLVMTADGLNLDTAMGAVAATLGNIGPGIGKVGPANNFYFISDFGKWFLSLMMLVGRLEIFTVIIIFSPYFWKNN